MLRTFYQSILITGVVILIESLFAADMMAISDSMISVSDEISKLDIDQQYRSATSEKSDLNADLSGLNASLTKLLQSKDSSECTVIIEKILKKIGEPNVDNNNLSESYYLIGVFHLIFSPVSEAIRYLNLCVNLKEMNNESDGIYANALYNLGVLYSKLGDYKKHEAYSLRALNVEKEKYGESSSLLIDSYSSLGTAFIQQQNYEKAIYYSNFALAISNNPQDSVSPILLANLYHNLGVCYNRVSDYDKAITFYEMAELILDENNLTYDENYINLLNNLANNYRSLRLLEKSDEYFKKGVDLAVNDNSENSYSMINSYAINLGYNGKKDIGEILQKSVLEKAGTNFGKNSHTYIQVLSNYAGFISEFEIDNVESLRCYEICLDYLSNHEYEMNLRALVLIGYSRALVKAGKLSEALTRIQSLLLTENGGKSNKDLYYNPALEEIIPDKTILAVLRTKYNIIWEIYRNTKDQNVLLAASNTAELIISLLEKVRINISEEESRLILGDNYRDSYLNAIVDFTLLYEQTSDRRYLEKAFEYSERSKVAGLLSSTRELKATQFHIPDSIAKFEKSLQRDISSLNASISKETENMSNDVSLINSLKEKLLKTVRMRDSMILVFENEYPEYYSIKFNTQVVHLDDIPKIIGRNGNYINYVVSDTLLYIFLVNRKHQQLITITVDSSFFDGIRAFRRLLLMPSSAGDAKTAFEDYQETGYKLYETMILPVMDYFISDKVLISPDNIISYIPFEVLTTSKNSGTNILYRELPYLMNDLNISYTYSATFLAESIKNDFRFWNKTVSFAPYYPDPIDIQSVLLKRQAAKGVLRNLPFASEEAQFVSDITHGDLYINGEAKESVYKNESGKYDIIHFAMHALLNDRDPMYSMLIFSPEKDSAEYSYLETFEVYGIPLKAKMVVLSSCNTGTGFLFSGEGIISLARGFAYSGSQSVVMSMWEIEDRSGTDIIKKFYTNLKKGKSKSAALKMARISFLKKSDQERSHPYFWATLVIYGDNGPLYYPGYLIAAGIFVLLSLLSTYAIYLRKRKYS